MGFAGVSGLRKILMEIKYGKQIGSMNKNMEVCFGKIGKDEKIYRTFNAKTGELVRKKTMHFSGKNYTYHVNNSKNDIIVKGEHTVYENLTSHNSHSQGFSNHRQEFNNMGQTVHQRGITFSPDITKPHATLFSIVDKNVSKTYMNTVTGEKYTINCIS